MGGRVEPDTEKLLAEAAAGDQSARSELLERHRARLKRMVAIRFDRRLSSRVDSSDVVQDVMVEASRNFDDYLRTQPLPFYPWLRQFAEQRLIDVRRRHLEAKRRSVAREDAVGLPDESAMELAGRLVGDGPASGGLRKKEEEEQVRKALTQLSERDREVLILRYLEQLSTAETAAVMCCSEGATRARTLRALQRLREVVKHLGGNS